MCVKKVGERGMPVHTWELRREEKGYDNIFACRERGEGQFLM